MGQQRDDKTTNAPLLREGQAIKVENDKRKHSPSSEDKKDPSEARNVQDFGLSIKDNFPAPQLMNAIPQCNRTTQIIPAFQVPLSVNNPYLDPSNNVLAAQNAHNAMLNANAAAAMAAANAMGNNQGYNTMLQNAQQVQCTIAQQQQQLYHAMATMANGVNPQIVHAMVNNPPFTIPPIPSTPALTVQDRPLTPPIYNGVNSNYPGVQVLHLNPPIFAVENFLTPPECQFLIEVASDSFTPAPVVGPGAGEVSPSRTSSTCYLTREDLPLLMEKVCLLTGKPLGHCELPQVGRYLPSQKYLQHYDAFDLSNEDGRRFASNGGQRIITVLIYLNDVPRGGQTHFPSLNLSVQPKQGTAIVFFPATVDGLLDKMALHAALPAIDTKFVSQIWIRQGDYEGHPSKRLTRRMDHSILHDYILQQQQQMQHLMQQQQQQGLQNGEFKMDM